MEYSAPRMQRNQIIKELSERGISAQRYWETLAQFHKDIVANKYVASAGAREFVRIARQLGDIVFVTTNHNGNSSALVAGHLAEVGIDVREHIHVLAEDLRVPKLVELACSVYVDDNANFMCDVQAAGICGIHVNEPHLTTPSVCGMRFDNLHALTAKLPSILDGIAGRGNHGKTSPRANAGILPNGTGHGNN